MDNKIPWQPIPEDYDFENDFDAPNKLFWCKGPYGDGHWTNEELWENVPLLPISFIDTEGSNHWWKHPDLKITHWAWVNGPEEENKKEIKVESLSLTEAMTIAMSRAYENRLKVGEPKE